MPKRQPRQARRQPDREAPTGNRGREPDGAEFPSVSEEPLQPWLEPIGNTGFYQSPVEPVDPRDCDRWPDSPYCDGSGVNLDDFIDLVPNFHGNECEVCVTVSPTLAFISLPPYTVCYRKPECRQEPGEELPDLLPPMPPGDRIPIPRDPDGLYGGCDGEIYGVTILGAIVSGPDGQYRSEYSFEEETAPTYYVYGPIGSVSAVKILENRQTGEQYWGARIHCKGQAGDYLNWSPSDSGTYKVYSMPFLWTGIFPPNGNIAIRILVTREDGRTVDVCDDGELAPYPPERVPDPPPLNPLREPCCMNCAEQDRLLRLIAKMLGTDDYPASVPKSLLTGRDRGQQKIESLTQLIGWFVQQVDALVGEFPIEINVEDIDPTKPGKQSKKVTVPNIAEAIAELYGLALKNTVDSDIHTNFMMRLAAEIISTKNAAIVAQDYARANATFLGYKANPKRRKINYAFDPEGLESLETILKESEKYIQGWQEDDPETVVGFLQRIVFSAGIIKAAFLRNKDQLGNLKGDLDNLLKKDEGDQDDLWRQFLRSVENPNHRINTGNVPTPEIKDLSMTSNEGLGNLLDEQT